MPTNFSMTRYGHTERFAGGTPNCWGEPNGSWLHVSREVSESSVGVKRRKPQGWIPPTPYSFSRVDITYQRGTSRTYRSNGSTNCNYGTRYVGIVGAKSYGGRFNGLNHFNDIEKAAIGIWGGVDIISSLKSKSLIKARVQLKNSKVNLGVAFGERKQTARLLGDTASRIAKSFRHLKSGRIRKAMDELGITSRRREPRGSNVPQKWLELQYGWKPLLSEVHGAAEALEGRPPGDWRVTAKGSAQFDLPSGVIHTWNTSQAGEGRAEGFIGVFTRIDALPSNASLIALSSLGVTNPLLVAWELVPLSFVVDWAWPIGSWLESLDAQLGYDSAGTYSSVSALMKYQLMDKGVTYDAGTWTYENKYYGTKKVVSLNRSVFTGIPLPPLPRFKDPGSLGHMANGLSLLAAAFGRSNRYRL